MNATREPANDAERFLALLGALLQCVPIVGLVLVVKYRAQLEKMMQRYRVRDQEMCERLMRVESRGDTLHHSSLDARPAGSVSPVLCALLPAPVSEEGAATPEKTVYTLLDVLERRDALRPAHAELLAGVAGKARCLVDEVRGDRARFERITDMYASRLLLRLVALDKAGAKLDEINEKIDALQYSDLEHDTLVERVRNNFAHSDRIDRQIAKRCAVAHSGDDDFYEECASERKRGRKKKKRPAEAGEPEEEDDEFDAVEAINRPYITAKRSGEEKKPAGVDMARAFQRCLDVANLGVLKASNQGWYLENVVHMLRKLDARDHPLHELLALCNNMEYCVSYRCDPLQFDPARERFYCAASGAAFEVGERAHCLTFVERDAERAKEWKDYKLLDARVFEKPQMRRSVRTFLFKLELEGPVSLFPGQRAPSRPLAQRKRARRSAQSLLWELMCTLHVTLEARPTLRHRAWQYETERNRIALILASAANADDERALTLLDKLLYYFVASADATLDEPTVQREKAALFESVLDFVDTLGLVTERETHAIVRRLCRFAAKRGKAAQAVLDDHNPYLLLFVFLFRCVSDERRKARAHVLTAPDLLARLGLSVQ